jgi:hypothetical protein
MTFQKPISESQVFSIALSAFIKNDPAWKPAPTVSTDFAFHELTLTLDNRYTETNDTSSSLLKSPKYTVQINRFAISEQSEEIKTTEDFAWELLIDRPKDFDAETRSVVTENGLFYFILSSPDQPSIYYAVFVYESDTHYYTVAIGAPKMRFNDNFDYITEIAKSVRFE